MKALARVSNFFPQVSETKQINQSNMQALKAEVHLQQAALSVHGSCPHALIKSLSCAHTHKNSSTWKHDMYRAPIP